MGRVQAHTAGGVVSPQSEVGQLCGYCLQQQNQVEIVLQAVHQFGTRQSCSPGTATKESMSSLPTSCLKRGAKILVGYSLDAFNRFKIHAVSGRPPAGRVRREPSPQAVLALRAWPFPPCGRLTPTRLAALRAVACQHNLRARCCAEILLTQTEWKSKRRLRPRPHSYLPSNSTELCSTCTMPNRL